MKFAIITHVNHTQNDNQYFGYAPYVREMNIWLKYVDEVIIVAPLSKKNLTDIDLEYKHSKIDFRPVSDFSFTSFRNNLISLFKLPRIFLHVFLAIKKADHIHLRCPGNVGLIGCLVQILFPNKIKTAKYAGNWDPASKQPWTYKLQKYILNNTFLTRNMQVLVYGEWENQSRNIKPFFTATYSESEKTEVKPKILNSVIQFVFVGSLVTGKNPMYAVKLIHNLVKDGKKVILNVYGEGVERSFLEAYIKENKLEDYIFLRGNQNKEKIKEEYQKSHFVILPSKSEGWPKAIAEGMFWGCVPLVYKISCVPFMIDFGKRGIFLQGNLDSDLMKITNALKNEATFRIMSLRGIEWSQQFTIEKFEIEIKAIMASGS